MPTWDETSPRPYLERETGARRLSAVTVLIWANVAGLVLSSLGFFLNLQSLGEILSFKWQHGIGSLWLWQFLTYTFWHPLRTAAGNDVNLLWSVLGLAFGCWILHQAGRELEYEWGWKRFTVFYLVCGIYGAVAHAIYQTMFGSDVAAFDFLGPVLAVFLAWALKSPNRKIFFFFFFEMRAIIAALLFIGLIVLFCLANYRTGITPVASLGAVAAAWLIHIVEPRLDSLLDRRGARVAREHFLNDFELKGKVDAILEKISREGIGNLTSRERKLLKRASELYGDDHGRHE